jgi:uncharacterized protein involved in exopolysaccharide biosynthesis
MTSGSTGHFTLVSPTPRDIAATLFRHPRLLIGAFGIVLLASMSFILFSPRYESHFRVLLRRGRFDPVVSAQPSSATDFVRPEITEEELNSEVELLRDEDLLKQVVAAAKLVPAGLTDSERAIEIEHTLRKVQRQLEIDGIKKSNLIRVTYKDSDAERAARILLALSTLYIEKHTNLQRPPGQMEFFDRQTADSEKRLHHSETDLVNFTRVRGVISAATERDLTLQKLEEADAAYRQIDQERVETERTIASLGTQLKTFPSRSVTLKRWGDNEQLLEKLKTRLLELQIKRTELLTRFEPSYRLVLEIDQQIEQARTSIAAEALSPVRDETTDKDPNYEWARLELEKAQVRLEGLKARQSEALAQVSRLRTVAQQMQENSIDQQDLIRTAKADEDSYLLYLHKREEARIGQALDQQRILNVAIVEDPVAPVLPLHSAITYFVIAFGLALAISVGICFTAEYFDSTVPTPDEACKLLEVPSLAWLPRSEAKAPLSAIAHFGQLRKVD